MSVSGLNDRRLDLARSVAAKLAGLDGVEAVALGGSIVGGAADERSDVDLYVYAAEEPSHEARRAIAQAHGAGEGAEVGNSFFEPGDEWTDEATRVGVDVMYRRPVWIEDRLADVLDRHEASLGYSTCLWHNVLTSSVLFDRSGWYAGLKRRADAPYPEELRRNIVAKNRAMMAETKASWRAQLELAALRDDPVSLNHRVAAFLASWFDALFALNRRPHPGEKRLLQHVRALDRGAPPDTDALVRRFLAAAAAGEAAGLLRATDALITALDRLAAR